MIFLKINCPDFSRLVWRRHTKFQIGMAAAIPAIPLPAPRASPSSQQMWSADFFCCWPCDMELVTRLLRDPAISRLLQAFTEDVLIFSLLMYIAY